MTEIRWMGQSCFAITGADGHTIITDPFAHDDPVNYPGLEINYPPIDIEGDIVVISHMTHFDHDNFSAVGGDPALVNKPGLTTVRGVEFRGFATYHRGESGFSDTPFNNIFCFSVDGLRFCHVGDLGYVPDEGVLFHIGQPDILFVPVGEGFTAPHDQIVKFVRLVSPRIVIPMHYQTPSVTFLPKTADDFVAVLGAPVEQVENPFEVSPDTLPDALTVCVLPQPS